MSGGYAKKLVVLLLGASLAHVPFPCFDGDNRKSAEFLRGHAHHCSSAAGAPTDLDEKWDVDILLFGMDPPEDSDDGPFDQTPENRHWTGFGPSYLHVRGELGVGDRANNVRTACGTVSRTTPYQESTASARLPGDYGTTIAGANVRLRLLPVMLL